MDIILGLLVLSLGYIVLKMVAKIREQQRCIEDGVLLDFFHGRLSKKEEERRKVIAHLGICEKCQQKLIDLTKNNKSGVIS